MSFKTTNRASLAWVAALALAGCGNLSVVGGPVHTGDSGVNDIGAADVPMDVPMDVPADTGPARCMSNADCMGNAAGGVCDVNSGRCVQCLAANDTCPADQHCDPASNACVSGCRADEGCAMGGGDAGVDGGAAAGRCNTMTHACQECVVDAHCPPGNVCSAGSCVRGCMGDDRCATGERCCGGACVDLQSNAAHCGACGMACAVTNALPGCAMGACVIATCMAPFGNCDDMQGNGCEVNLNTDVAHCGACGNACPTRANATSSCDAGACGFTCNAGFADCNMDPSDGCEVELATSVGNCGMCGRACSAANGAATCAAGVCGLGQCSEGFADCNMDPTDGCEVDTRTTLAHCGACGRACMAPANGTAACVAGACGVASCGAGFADCDGMPGNGCEVNLGTSVGHCGACGRACATANGTPVCAAGACGVASCNTGFADCDGMPGNGCETNTSTSASHCGRCGNACMPATGGGAACTNGTCGQTCPAGQSVCGGVCRVTATDLNNCGACGNVCPTPANGTAACAGGACGVGMCAAGFGNCDANAGNGCETATASNTSHCGACGVACPARANATTTCAAGTCGFTCGASFANCNANAADGCEVNTQTDTANCGACGRACASGQACVAGACIGQGTLRFTLTWDTNGDLDLHVVPPCGTEIYYGQTSACGGTLDRDDTSVRGPENVFWASNYTPGRYYVCPEAYSSAVANALWTLTVVRNGVTVHTSTGRRGRTDGNVPCSASFPGVVTLNL